VDSWEIALTIAGSIFGSTGLWTLINNIYQNKREKKSAERSALLGLLHDKVYHLCGEYIERGYVYRSQYDNLSYIYDPYIALGGNGTGKRLKAEVDKLPIKEDPDPVKRESEEDEAKAKEAP